MTFPLPDRNSMVAHCVQALRRYWPLSKESVEALPVASAPSYPPSPPLQLTSITLPDWAADLGIDGRILVPVEAATEPETWEETDWWLAVFLLLECWHERCWEEVNGPIHSYSFRLKGWDTRVWERAWVNRIALFLRRWSARNCRGTEHEVHGQLPAPQILLTHDVDALDKTWAIRLKQGAFNLFNCAKALGKGDISLACTKLRSSLRFLASGGRDWQQVTAVSRMEQEVGIRARFHFFADRRRQTLRRWLIDPSYDIWSTKAREVIKEVAKAGHEVELHPSCDSWDSPGLIMTQRKNLEVASGRKVQACRQHWLRFSWARTWMAQEEAGITCDTTLMFNDRSGFRASAALSWHPWGSEGPMERLEVTPTLFMDSHFYDYSFPSQEERRLAMKKWLDEVRAVSGQIGVLWHPHTLSQDYGWAGGFKMLMQMVGAS